MIVMSISTKSIPTRMKHTMACSLSLVSLKMEHCLGVLTYWVQTILHLTIMTWLDQ